MTRVVVDPVQQAGPPAPQPTPPPALRELRAEASRLHRALFRGDAPEEVQRQYVRALRGARLAEVPRGDLTRLMQRGVDLEAIELALRRRTPTNTLTQRCHVLCYLVEVRPEYFGRFVNEPARPIAGALTLGLHTIRSLYKLIKGRCLLRLHHVG